VAVAIIQDWLEPETERSTVNYDAVSERLQQQEEPIDGLHVHSAGYTGSGFRIYEIWESREHFDRFLQDRLMPMLLEQQGPENMTPPTMTVYELHRFMTA
jgi:quinol monooxygenase YgiN